jgi:hypothetical protein
MLLVDQSADPQLAELIRLIDWFYYATSLNSQILRPASATTKGAMQNAKDDNISFSLDHSLIMGQ